MTAQFDISKAREHFPALQQDQVFLDNAGGSQALGAVIDSYVHKNVKSYYYAHEDIVSHNIFLRPMFNLVPRITQERSRTQNMKTAIRQLQSTSTQVVMRSVRLLHLEYRERPSADVMQYSEHPQPSFS